MLFVFCTYRANNLEENKTKLEENLKKKKIGFRRTRGTRFLHVCGCQEGQTHRQTLLLLECTAFFFVKFACANKRLQLDQYCFFHVLTFTCIITMSKAFCWEKILCNISNCTTRTGQGLHWWQEVCIYHKIVYLAQKLNLYWVVSLGLISL